MASITRTAYPQLKVAFSESELQALYQLSTKELDFVRSNTRKQANRITLSVLLKCHQSLGYFPDLRKIPDQLKGYLAEQLGIEVNFTFLKSKRTIYRYYKLIRNYLKIKNFDQKATNQLEVLVRKSAYTMSDPADLINVALEELIRRKYELPAFETLDRWVSQIREEVHQILYAKITASLSDEQRDQLEAMLQLRDEERLTDFTLLKQVPGKPTLSQMKSWIEKLDWIQTFPPTASYLKDVSHTKIRQFAAEAYGLEVGDMKDIVNISKRHSLLICLIYQSEHKTRDELVEIFIRRMRRTETGAKNHLQLLREKHRQIEEELMETFSQVVRRASGEVTDTQLGADVRQVLQTHGGPSFLLDQYQMVSAWHNNNYWPLLWKVHKSYRKAIFQLVGLLNIQSATQDQSLVEAFTFIQSYKSARRDYLPDEISLTFASGRWKSFVSARQQGETVLKRRELEVCIFLHITRGLDCGDLYIDGSEKFADYRQQLLDNKTCEEKLPDYCVKMGFPSTAKGFVNELQKKLRNLSQRVDQAFPQNRDLRNRLDLSIGYFVF